MSSWYLAPSLVALRDEIDAIWPNRDRSSDGAVGDAAHSKRLSEHNPDSRGCVHALDIDVDGIDYVWVRGQLIGDPRVWYVVSDRMIYSRTYGWKARDYTGADPHVSHIHVSLRMDYAQGTDREQEVAAENDVSRWLDDYKPATPTSQGDDDEMLSQEAQKWIEDRLDAHDTFVLANLKATLGRQLEAVQKSATATQAQVAKLATGTSSDKPPTPAP